MQSAHNPDAAQETAPRKDVPQKNVFDAAAAVVYTATLFLAPLFYLSTTSFPLFASKHLVIVLGVLTSLGLWAVARLKEGAIDLPQNPLIWTLLGLLCVYFLSALFASPSHIALIGGGFVTDSFLTFVVFAAAAMLGPLILSQSKQLLISYLVLIASSILAAIVIGLQLSGVSLSMLLVPSELTILGSWQDAGIWYALTAVLSIVTLGFLDLRWWMQAILYLLLAGSLALIAFSGLVGIWWVLAITAGVYLVYVFGPFQGRTPKMQLSRTIAPAAMVLICSLVGIFFAGSIGFIDDSRDASSAQELSFDAGLAVSGATLNESPILGVGPNRFDIAYAQHTPSAVYAGDAWDVDFELGSSYLFTVPTTLGVIGTVGWLALLALLLAVGVRALALTQERQPLPRYLILSSFLCNLLLFGALLVYAPNTLIIFTAFVFLGIFISVLYNEGIIPGWRISFVSNPRAGFISIVLLACMTLGAISCIYTYANKYTATMHFYRAQEALAADAPLDVAAQSVDAAIASDTQDAYYRTAAQISLARLNQLVGQNQSDTQVVQARLAEAIQHARSAIDIDGADFRNWMMLGRIYAALVPQGVSGAYTQANDAFNQAVQRNPDDPEILLSRARLELAAGNQDEAKQLAREAQAIKEDYTAATFLLTRIQVQEGNITAARESARSAAEIAPNDPTIFFQLGVLEYESENYDRAIQALEQATQIAPGYANAKYYLGLSYAARGSDSEALSVFQEILETNPDNQRVQQIIANIQAGRSPLTDITSGDQQEQLPVDNQ